jgi:uncharacterized protein (DUF3820 family)
MNNDPLDTPLDNVESYDDLDLLDFGKYKNERLQDIPASYFHWLWSQGRPMRDPRLEAYIKKNLKALKEEYPDGIWA